MSSGSYKLWLDRTFGCFFLLEVCIVFLGTMAASLHRRVMKVSGKQSRFPIIVLASVLVPTNKHTPLSSIRKLLFSTDEDH